MKTQRLIIFLPIIFFIALLNVFFVGKQEKYKDPSVQIEERISDLLSRMTLEEKVAQLSGHGLSTDENVRLGIPGLRMTDGPLGVRTGKATAFPAGEALAASWDTVMLNKIGKAIANEVKGKGLNMLLGPCVDIHRLPVNGRNFEGYGEDPFLSAQLVKAYINGVQDNGVIATVKHFTCENQQWERFKLNAVVDERALQEIYFPPFKAAITEAKALAVMASYNKVNGFFGTENKYFLTDVLKNNWNFQGLVVSDWDATHHTLEAAHAGLDIEMPQPVYFGQKLLDAVKNGEVSESEINEKVKRVLRVKFAQGLFDKPNIENTSLVNSKENQSLALEAAQKGIVLLKNKNNVLPLDKNKVKTIAVIGPNGNVCRTGGGGSSLVLPYYSISPLEGIKKKVPNANVSFSIGDELDKKGLASIESKYFFTDASKSAPGLKAEYFNNAELKGSPLLTRVDNSIDFNFMDNTPAKDIGNDNFSIRWSGVLVSPVPKKYIIYTEADDGVRMYIDNKLVIENWDFHGIERDSVEIFLDQNKPHDIRLEYFDGQMNGSIKLAWNHEAEGSLKSDASLILKAVEAAKKSEVAIIFVGLSEQFEGEAGDANDNLMLPNNQEKLIKEVSKVNPNTIVVLNSGVPLSATSWINNVAGFLETFYLGQETGNAIADVLFGDFNPSGRLPFSYIKNKADSPAFKGYKDLDLNAKYTEGIYVGYRYYDKNNIAPLFPFGFGLSYTNFEYSNMKIVSTGKNKFEVSVNVRNVGSRAGSEVVQLYLKDIASSLDRPEKELKSFSKIYLKPGEQKTVIMKLKPESFAFYNTVKKSWVTEAGDFEVLAASSSRDIRLKKNLKIE